jgi:excisionase family DNA binding protein
MDAIMAVASEWLDVEQAADYLNVGPRWIYERTAAGTIPVKRLGRLLRFRRSDLDAWVNSGAAASA